MKITAKMTGLAELRDNLKRLRVEHQEKALKSTVNIAVKPHVEAAKSIVARNSFDSGALFDAIQKKTFSGANSRPYAAASGIKMSSTGRKAGWRWHWAEFGTNQRKWKSGKSTGVQKAEPFLRPSFRQTKDKMAEMVRVLLARRILSNLRAQNKAIR